MPVLLDLQSLIRTGALDADAPPEQPKNAAACSRLLRSIRDELRMDVVYIGELSDALVLRWIEGDARSFGLELGGRAALEGTYCHQMAQGLMPSLICDAVNDPHVRDLDATSACGIGCYVGVPLILPDGRMYGSLCAMSHVARPDLDERNVEALRHYAGLVAQYVAEVGDELATHADRHARVAGLIERREVRAVFQPIVNLVSRRTVGFEALARFAPPDPSPLRWFADAEVAGLRARLEVAAVNAAVNQLDLLPGDAFLSLNLSPDVLAQLPRLDLDAFAARIPLRRLVLEVTERAPVEDYVRLADALREVRACGVRLAIDDAGAGFASMMHIVRLHPEFIKLDVGLVRGIDRDPSSQALARSLVAFAESTGADVVAEGIETASELRALKDLRVSLGQGYLLARPADASVFTAARIQEAPVRKASSTAEKRPSGKRTRKTQ